MKYLARISVFGGRKISNENYKRAYKLGRLLSKNKYLVYCGCGEGVMEAVSKVVQESGGQCVGILKGIFSAMQIPMDFVSPVKWKKYYEREK